jgi:hypothetical protein
MTKANKVISENMPSFGENVIGDLPEDYQSCVDYATPRYA